MEQMSFFIGGFAAILLLALGFLAGWLLRGSVLPRAPKREAPTASERQRLEQERKQMIDRQNAFRLLQDYSAERAYGMIRPFDDPPERAREG